MNSRPHSTPENATKTKKNGRDFETGGEKIHKYTLAHIRTKFQIS